MSENSNEDWQEITDFLGGSTNKIVYLVRVEEPIGKTKSRAFLTSKIIKGDVFLEFTGHEIKVTNIDKIKTYDDAIKIANEDKFPLVNIIYPWRRIINVKNVSYYKKDK